jgi:FKBP-type peptidyl-prolyl cis-trans isomerase FkpA
MRHMTRTMALVVALTTSALSATAISAEVKVEPKTDDQKALYAMGYIIGGNLSGFNLSAEDLKFIEAGLSDKILQKNTSFDAASANALIQALQTQRLQAGITKARAAGDAYLLKAAAVKGATKLPSGLVIQTINEGSGATPTAADTVKVHYTGTLIDGKKFDSSVDRGAPASFPLNGVIPCWTEGVQQIKVGGKAKLTCPADLAYGDRPSPEIPAGSTLVFDVELLEIVKDAKP